MKTLRILNWGLAIAILSILMLNIACEKDSSGPPPTISTVEVTGIKDMSVTCGGKVTDKGGSNIVALGLCWSKEKQEPTVSDNYVPFGEYTKSGIVKDQWEFTTKITGLQATTKYYVRAYAANENGVAYGEVKSFTTKAGKIFHKLTEDMLETYTQEVTEGPKKSLVDGNLKTYWHSAWSSATAPLPHHIQINFAEEKSIGGFVYWHRNPSGSAGRPNQFDLQTSSDGTTWTTVWTSKPDLSTKIDPATYEIGNIISCGKNFKSKLFRLRIISNPGNKPFTYLAELKVFEDGSL